MLKRRILAAADTAAYEAFLEPHRTSSMFLRSNVASRGFRGTSGDARFDCYGAEFSGDAIIGIVAHVFRGSLLLQMPTFSGALVDFVLDHSELDLQGIVGPWSQVVATDRYLGLESRPTTLRQPEDLFELELDRLRVPRILEDGEVSIRRAEKGDIDWLWKWARDYQVESLGETDTPELAMRCRRSLANRIGLERLWILYRGAQAGRGEAGALSMTAFNAALLDSVQIGGVFTPPAERSKHYARAAVAASLIEARASGVERAILFTGHDNVAAQRSYIDLGFECIGQYGLLMYRDAVPRRG